MHPIQFFLDVIAHSITAIIPSTPPWAGGGPSSAGCAVQERDLWKVIDCDTDSKLEFCNSCKRKLQKYILLHKQQGPRFSSWLDASNACQNDLGSTLASIQIQRDWEEIRALCHTSRYLGGVDRYGRCHLGLVRNPTNEIIKWVDNTSYYDGYVYATYGGSDLSNGKNTITMSIELKGNDATHGMVANDITIILSWMTMIKINLLFVMLRQIV